MTRLSDSYDKKIKIKDWIYSGTVTKLPPADPDEIRAKLPYYLRGPIQRRPWQLRVLGRNPELSDPDAEGGRYADQ